MIRPFFFTPDGKTPLPSKRYYDIFTIFLTQTAFAFTVAPFIYLSLADSLIIWGRVYFYTLIGTAASFALFSRSLPFRKALVKKQSDRVANIDENGLEKVVREVAAKEKRDDLLRRESTETLSSGMKKAPTLGLPDDPEAEIEEIVAEVKKEIEERKRRGSLVQGFDIQTAVKEKLKALRS